MANPVIVVPVDSPLELVVQNPTFRSRAAPVRDQLGGSGRPERLDDGREPGSDFGFRLSEHSNDSARGRDDHDRRKNLEKAHSL